MKKIIAMMALTLVVVSASAASIDWNVSLTRAQYIYDFTGAKMTGNIYLVLADTTLDTSSTAAFDASLSAATLDKMTVSGGKVGSSQTATSDVLESGTSYDFAIVVYDSTAGYYYMTASSNKPAYTVGVDEASEAGFAGSNFSSPNWTKTTTAVPEPASAMLALAGVAMLIRRRK